MEAKGGDSPTFDAQPNQVLWQFSLRALLIFTAAASVLLAIFVHFAGMISVLIAIVLVKVGTLLAADWLIRPQNRRALAFVTAASWAMVGGGLAIVGGRELLQWGDVGTSQWKLTFAFCMLILSAFCFLVAASRWRQLNGPRMLH